MENRINTTDEELNKVIGYVEQYLDATEDARRRAERARDYKDGYQWTEQERNILKNRNQPCITNNRIKPKVQFLIGMEQKTRTDPKAYPRKPESEQEAEVSTDALRFIEDNNMSKQRFSRGFEYYLVEGTQGHEVIAELKNDKFEIVHNVLPWDRLFWDPHSRCSDFSDARWKGTLQWMDVDAAKEKFPDAPEESFSVDGGSTGNGTSETHEDKPSYFIDAKRKRIRVFVCFYMKQGQWYWCIFTKSGWIQKPEVSPYEGDNGQPEPQFEFQSAFVDMDGNRYGEVESYIDMQDEINKRRSKLLHLMSVRQTFGTKGAVGEGQAVIELKKELAKPDGHLEFQDGKFGQDFGVIPTSDMASGQAILLTEAKQEIDSAGANAALSGTEERQMSGRALQSLQQGGTVELGPLFDGQRYLKNRVHRMMWNRARQFWTEERWVRVTDNEDKLKFTRINGKITLRDQLRMKFEEQGEQAFSPEERFIIETNDPRLDNVIDVENKIQDMDVDLVIDETADVVTLQQEQFDVLARLYEANPQAIPFELIVKASQLRNKDELIEMLEGGTDEEKAALAQARQ